MKPAAKLYIWILRFVSLRSTALRKMTGSKVEVRRHCERLKSARQSRNYNMQLMFRWIAALRVSCLRLKNPPLAMTRQTLTYSH